MIDQLYPVQPGGIASPASPRRLPVRWLWVTRVLWVLLFLGMVYLNGAAIVAHVDRNASDVGSGAAGLRAKLDAEQAWRVTVDATGPAAAAGIQTGDVLLAVDGVALDGVAGGDTDYKTVNRLLFGEIGASMSMTVRGADGVAREQSLVLVEEDVLQIWRRFRVPLGLDGGYLPTIEAILLTVYLLTAALIFWRRSDDWLALYLTVTLVLITPQMSYSWYYLSLTAPHWDNVLRVIIAVAVALTLPNFYLLPNGIFVPRWSVLLALVWVVWSITTELFPTARYSIYLTSGATQLLVWLAWFATGMLAQFYRFRVDATPTERQQIKWVAFGLTVAVVVNLGWTLAFELFPTLSHVGQPHQTMWLVGRTVYGLGMMTLPISLGIAVFRYRLWDIDNLINRTLVYGTLTAIIVGIYVVVVSVFDALFSSEGQMLSQIIAITLDLIIFEPLRERLQKGVDRLMFGDSEDLPTVVTRLGQRLSKATGRDEVLPAIVETLAESLHLPYVAIALPEGDSFRIAAASGAHIAAHFTWPLVYQRQAVGQLLLAARTIGEPLKADEWQTVEIAAYHISTAVHDLLLDYELHGDKLSGQEASNPPQTGNTSNTQANAEGQYI